MELKRRMLLRELRKEFPYAKSALPDICVVKEHDRIVRKLPAPYRKIALDVLVKMAAVDMKQIDRPVCEIFESLLKRRAHQGGESGVFLAVPTRNRVEYFFTEEPGVLVALPSVDGVSDR